MFGIDLEACMYTEGVTCLNSIVVVVRFVFGSQSAVMLGHQHAWCYRAKYGHINAVFVHN